MTHFTINKDIINSESLPTFSLTVEEGYTTAIYSDMEMQLELTELLRSNGKFSVFDLQEGLYERLTVQDNITFFHKWFGCQIPIPEVLVFFELQNSAKQPLHKCSKSEIYRIYYAKYFMSGTYPMIFREPIHGVDVRTRETFMNMLQKLKDTDIPLLVLVSNLEHAILLGDCAYKLQKHALQPVEVDEQDDNLKESTNTGKVEHMNIFKIPAKVEDKMILFDPLEIDYIESQDGKAMIVINDKSYALDATLTDMELRLAVYGFYRCHRSYIVNLQKVREIITWSKNSYSLRIDNQLQATIPLSRTKIQEIQEKFSLK